VASDQWAGGQPRKLGAMTLARDTDRIESERLILRRIEQADFEFFARIHADPIVARYLGNGKTRSVQETQALLERLFESYESMELGPLAVLRKSDGVLIGRCGLSDMALEVNPASGELPRVWYQRSQVPSDTNVIFEQELGYTFDRNYWGQGYAGEAAARVFEYASSTARFRRIVSVIHPDNAPSIKIEEVWSAAGKSCSADGTGVFPVRMAGAVVRG
jgi:ribosomal-protein-alanine N-acetyltransferase